jgi:hypothetical protein
VLFENCCVLPLWTKAAAAAAVKVKKFLTMLLDGESSLAHAEICWRHCSQL